MPVSRTLTPQRKILLGAILVMGSLIIGLAVTEIIFRLTRPPHGELFMGFQDSLHHHKLKPNQVIPNGGPTTARINALGYRGEDFPLKKPAGETRVLMLGDSCTWGATVGDDAHFPGIMDRYFKARNIPVKIINGGFPSYSPVLHYLRTKDEHLRIEPDHVFLFYDLTDLQDDFNYEKHLVKNARGEIVACNPMYVNGRLNVWKVLTAKSVFARYFHNKVIRTYQKIRMVGLGTYIKIKLEGKRTKSYLAQFDQLDELGGDMIAYDRYIMIRDPSRLPVFEKHWPRSAKYILMLRDLLAARGIGFTLVIYPHGPQVSAGQWKTGKTLWGFEPDKVYDDPYAWDHIKAWAGRERVPLIDALPYFKQHGDEELFFDNDVHPTPHGQEIFAEALLTNDTFNAQLGLSPASDEG